MNAGEQTVRREQRSGARRVANLEGQRGLVGLERVVLLLEVADLRGRNGAEAGAVDVVLIEARAAVHRKEASGGPTEFARQDGAVVAAAGVDPDLKLLYVVLAFLGCLDREEAVRRSAWKEGRREASREVDRVLNRCWPRQRP